MSILKQKMTTFLRVLLVLKLLNPLLTPEVHLATLSLNTVSVKSLLRDQIELAMCSMIWSWWMNLPVLETKQMIISGLSASFVDLPSLLNKLMVVWMISSSWMRLLKPESMLVTLFVCQNTRLELLMFKFSLTTL